jgi:hypothetical protein
MTIRRSMAVVALLAVILGAVFMPLYRQAQKETRRAEYERVALGLVRALDPLENSVPPGVSPSDWACAVRATVMCQVALCFGDDPISIEDLYRLRADLAPALRGPVDLETLEWIWGRFARTSPEAARLVDRIKTKYDACFPRKH